MHFGALVERAHETLKSVWHSGIGDAGSQVSFGDACSAYTTTTRKGYGVVEWFRAVATLEKAHDIPDVLQGESPVWKPAIILLEFSVLIPSNVFRDMCLRFFRHFR